MADPDVFNGATVVWPTTTGSVLGTGLRAADDGQSGADVDLSVTTSSFGSGRPGINKREINLTMLGTSTASHGDAGFIRITFGDTGGGPTWLIGTTTQANHGSQAYIANKLVGGGMDGEVTSTFTFRPRKSS